MDITAPVTSFTGLSSEALAGEIRLTLTNFVEARDLAVSAASHAVRRAITLGELFETAALRFPGNFTEWCETNFPDIGRMTVWRFRKVWRQRAQLMRDEPVPARLKDAYVALGMLPPPDQEPGNAEGTRPLYTFRLVVSGDKPIADWPKIDLIEFVDKTKPLADLRDQAMERLAALN